ncbi:MAG: undecaprenyl-phosphate glucose phosphotransferase [Siculibacillus sp.]|nr:undecaprenyl-phosphate glucose phosphotransferase [Siculibacillus sp.]
MSQLDQGQFTAGLWDGAESGGRRLRWTLEVLQAGAIVLDITLIMATALSIRLLYPEPAAAGWGHLLGTVHIGVLTSILFVGFMAMRRGYAMAALSSLERQTVLVAQAWIFAFFWLGWVAFLAKVTETYSRGAVSIWFFFGFASLLLVHVFGARWLARRFARGEMSVRRVAVVAVADDAGLERISHRLALRGIEVVTLTAISPARIGRSGFLGAARTAVGNVRQALAARKLDAVYLFLSWRERRHIEELKAAMAPLPVPVYLFADREIERLIARGRERVGDLVGFELQRAPLSRVDRAMKRSLDVAVATTALVVLSPLLVLTALAVLVETGRPVFFRQKRKGFGARPFTIFKFRSMSVQENGSVVTQATKNDARVTRLGRVLRRTSIDELPQLFNVLAGDMSIVGPRPHAVAHDDLYDGLIASYAFRQHVKPGITGWAQVNGWRGETREVDQMKARVEHDIWYINNWSLWLDVKIIAMTALKIFFDDQAY